METGKTKGPKSPDIKELGELIDRYETGALVKGDDTKVTDALKWTVWYLTDRKVYHKKKKLEEKAFIAIAKEMMAKDEIEAVEKKVDAMSDAQLLGGKND